MQFSEGLRAERIRQKLSQTELSKISGSPQSTISAIEKGDRIPTEVTMAMIAKGLGCSVGYLLGETAIKKEPAASNDELDADILNLVGSLSDSDFQRVRDFVAGLIASRSEPSSHQE